MKRTIIILALALAALVAGIALTAEGASAAEKTCPAGQTVYTVVKGNTWSGLAKTYGKSISKLNGKTDKSKLLVGDKLCVPTSGGSAPAPKPAPAPSNGKRCKAVEGYTITVCVVISDSSGTAKARIYQNGEDVYGVITMGVSVVDSNQATNPLEDFLTPLSSFSSPRTPLCQVKVVPKDGTVCGDRKLFPGLVNATVFDSGEGVFAIHKAPGGVIGESHGCIRASSAVAKFLIDSGSDIALVVLDVRGVS